MLSHVKFQFIFLVLVLLCLFVFFLCVFSISLNLINIFSVNFRMNYVLNNNED